MKKALFLILCLFLVQAKGNCDNVVFPPLQPLRGMDNSIDDCTSNNVTTLSDPFVNSSSSVKYPDITKVELALFGRNFANQSLASRLSRIEKSMFSRTYQSSSELQRIDNIISNFNQINKYPNISQPGLNKMERQVFNQTFPQNNPQRRIERLEEQLFGAVQSGDLNARYEAVKMASKAYNKTSDYIPNNSYGTSGWKGLAAALGNSLTGGYMTGFTPPITPYYGNGYNRYNRFNGLSNFVNPNRFNYSNPYMRAYGSPYTTPFSPSYGYTSPYSSAGSYGSNGTSTRHIEQNGFTNYGSGASVTILD